MIERAKAFVRSDEFIRSAQSMDAALPALAQRVGELGDSDFAQAAATLVAELFDRPPRAVVDSAEFRSALPRVADSIIAAACLPAVPAVTKTLLVNLAKALWLLQHLADRDDVTRNELQSVAILLPENIFPLPPSTPSLAAHRKAQAEAVKKDQEQRRLKLLEMSRDLGEHRGAVRELLGAFERSGTRAAPGGIARIAPAGRATAGFSIPDEDTRSFSDSTRRVLRDARIPETGLDVAKAVTLIENRAVDIATRLHANRSAATFMVRIGNQILPSDLVSDFDLVATTDVDEIMKTPGACPPQPIVDAPADEASVPTTRGEARILGIADLMVVEQDLLRYQYGEIAHIENVLKSELRARTFRTSSMREESEFTESETSEEQQRDLATSDRFNLQTETQNVITENTSKDAGVTVNASYGPSVDVTASFNYATSNSRQNSNRASSSFAREVTSRAVSRLQKRSLERRSVRTVEEIEETNKHSFDNKEGLADISGIYRFVDKIYKAQIVNYGKRLMLEFVVPEPAAFLRYALANRPLDGVTQVKPQPPGYCIGNGLKFVPLQAQDITPENYLYWASEYQAQDIEPPPPSTRLVSDTKKSPDQMPAIGDNGVKISSDVLNVTIPDGYLPQSAFVNIYGETQTGTHKLVFQIQEQQGMYSEPVDDNHLFYLHLHPTATVPVTINSLRFHNYEVLVTVFCTLAVGKYQEWQIKTYNAIMNAYNDRKSRYDKAMEAARIQASYGTVTGSNPFMNRETEKTELKKGCISLLTAQRFDAFGAVGRNVAPHGFPEIDFEEARDEGAYIQFFEQSFEWNNVTYVFYPYFWSRKEDWIVLAQLNDDDPLFTRFLQAGAARVQVPVRLGFEEGILQYLAVTEPWNGEGTLVNTTDGEADDTHLSIVDELKSQMGNNNSDGTGTLTVTKDDDAVTGLDTRFTADDERRRIVIRGTTYVIAAVTGPTTCRLETPYAGTSVQGAGYSLGGKLVGEPWEVKLPTNLIKLDSALTIS